MSALLSGTRAWLVQRVSALYMALYLPALLCVLLWVRPVDHAAWRALLERPVVGMSFALFYFALLLHAWVGIRDVILDYVGRRDGLRLALLAVVAFWLVGLGLWLLRVLLPVVVT